MTNGNVLTNIKSWFSSNGNQERKDYRNKVNISARRLLLNFDITKIIFDYALLDAVQDNSKFGFDAFGWDALVAPAKYIKKNVELFGFTPGPGAKTLDSLTIKEIYYFSDQSESDLIKNLPSSNKFFGLATMIYFAGWWLKRYWYTNLFLKKIRLISAKFNSFDMGTKEKDVVPNSNNVVSINKNRSYDGFDVFVYDMFVDLLVNKVWARKDSMNMFLTKKDIQEVKDYMLKNENMFGSLNYSTPERKKDFSRFNGKNDVYKTNWAKEIARADRADAKRFDIGKWTKEHSVKIVSKEPNDSTKDNNLKESQKLALENIRVDCVKDSKKDYDFEQYKTIYDNKFDIKTKNANDSIKKELKESSELIAATHPTEQQRQAGLMQSKREREFLTSLLKKDIRTLLLELKKFGSEPIVEFTKSTDYKELIDIETELTKMLKEFKTKDFSNKKD